MIKHVVETGDTLKRIAARYYGSEDKWPVVYNANRKSVSTPAQIYTGQVLNIP